MSAPTLRSALPILCSHILPGAEEAGVTEYVERVLEEPRLSTVGPILEHGYARLEAGCVEIFGQGFLGSSGEEQAQLLEMLAEQPAPWARSFFQQLVSLCLEGFLSHPSRGGNRDHAGWRAIGYPPAADPSNDSPGDGNPENSDPEDLCRRPR